jgi:predicted acetyltransferase
MNLASTPIWDKIGPSHHFAPVDAMTKAHTLIRPLRKDDLDALYRIRQIAFLDNMSLCNPEIQATHVASLPYKYGRFVDDRLVSSASWYPFEMHLRGKQIRVGGLASVVSAADSRRQGHVRTLLGHGLEMLRDEHIAWCLEYPFDTRYYRRFGWEAVANGFHMEVPIARFARFDPPSPIRRVEPDDEEALASIRRIYETWASDYNFTMVRDELVRDDWKRILSGTPWHESDDHARFIFLAKHAYCVVKLSSTRDAQTLHLLDYAFETPIGRQSVFAFVNSFAGQVDTVHLQLAPDDPLALEWPNFMVANPHPLHARIVDAAAAMSGLAVDQHVDLTVEVRDDFCDWNNGTYRLGVNDGSTVATKTEKPANICVDIRELAQILSGSLHAVTALKFGLADGDAESISQLCSLVSHPCHMPLADYF